MTLIKHGVSTISCCEESCQSLGLSVSFYWLFSFLSPLIWKIFKKQKVQLQCTHQYQSSKLQRVQYFRSPALLSSLLPRTSFLMLSVCSRTTTWALSCCVLETLTEYRRCSCRDVRTAMFVCWSLLQEFVGFQAELTFASLLPHHNLLAAILIIKKKLINAHIWIRVWFTSYIHKL